MKNKMTQKIAEKLGWEITNGTAIHPNGTSITGSKAFILKEIASNPMHSKEFYY